MKAIVVGAGAGGLVAAWELARAGWVVTVIEAGERPGGLLNRVVVDDLALDVGAEGYSVRGGAVVSLLHAATRAIAPTRTSRKTDEPAPRGGFVHDCGAGLTTGSGRTPCCSRPSSACRRDA